MKKMLNVNQAQKTLQEAGFKHTRQRDMILKLLQGNRTHPTADDIIDKIIKKTGHVTVATVYNTLDVLTQQGLIKKLDGLETKTHYDTDTSKHYHCICTKCKQVFDLEAPEKIGIDFPEGFILSDCMIQGLCDKCKDK